MRVRLFGFLPFGEQAIVIMFPETITEFAMRDAGYSRFITTWDHLITIRPSRDRVVYCDEVDVRAGVFTPLVWLFAQPLSRHRQLRWRRLAETHFVALPDVASR